VRLKFTHIVWTGTSTQTAASITRQVLDGGRHMARAVDAFPHGGYL